MHAEIDRNIHPDDAMWQPSERWYFRVGRSALRLVKLAEQASGLERVGSVLDLPCGHGRVARHLRAAYPDAEMYFCDINTGGADHCAQAFRGHAIHSQSELTNVDLPQVDLVWVGSLFTHVDLDRTRRWLHHLCARLNPGGVLVATLHGPWSQRMHEAHYPMTDPGSWQRILAGYHATGYGYAPYADSAMGDYGISLCKPEAIIGLVREIPGVRLAGYVERGWADNHDVVMIAKEDRERAWTPDFPI